MELRPQRGLEHVLVTGGTGFLGRAVAERLVTRGFVVTSLARHADATLHPAVRQLQGDIADWTAVRRAVENVDAVVHTAAKAGVYGAYADFFRANVQGTQNVLDACAAERVRYLVYTSSPSVTFDGTDQEGVDERVPYPSHFLAAYPATKAEAERRALAAHGAELSVIALRPHLIWGPGDPHLVPRVVALARAGKLRFVGRGEKLVDAVYIDNAADAHLAALQALALRPKCVGGRAYFVTNEEPWPLEKIMNAILTAAGVAAVTRRVPATAAYLAGAILEGVHGVLRRKDEPAMTRFVARQLATSHWYRTDAARLVLGYRPSVPMQEGFARLTAHFRGQDGPPS